jgi:hypothetical protein
LHAEILATAAELSDGPDDLAANAALATIEALHNQLSRGLSMLAAVSESTTAWQPGELLLATARATADVVAATAALAKAPTSRLPAAVGTVTRVLTQAAATHAAIMASIERTAGLKGESG